MGLPQGVPKLQVQNVGRLVLHAQLPHQLQGRHALDRIGQGDHGDKDGPQGQLGGSQSGTTGDGEGVAASLAPPLFPGPQMIVVKALASWAYGFPVGLGPA